MEKKEDADWRPRITSSVVSLSTTSMLANSLGFVPRLSAVPIVDGNDYNHAESQHQRIVADSPSVEQSDT